MRLRQLIRAQWPPLTQRAFATRMGTSEFMLSHWLSGRREPPAGFWAAAARELGVDPSELMSTNGALADDPKEAISC